MKVRIGGLAGGANLAGKSFVFVDVFADVAGPSIFFGELADHVAAVLDLTQMRSLRTA